MASEKERKATSTCSMIDPEFFTIKLFYGGEMHEEPGKYVGGSYAYFDYCHKDEFSKLDIFAMLRELGEIKNGVLQLWYRFPRNNGANSIYYELETDKDVLYMVDMMEDVVPGVKYAMVFAAYSDQPLSSQPEAHMGNVEPDPMNTQYEDVKFEEGNGTPVQQNDIGGFRSTNGDHDETSEESNEEYKGGSEDDSESFHSDSSNEDEDEDPLEFEKNLGETEFDMGEQGGHFEKENSSDYGGSDEERMACNSTDDENEDFPVFQEGDGVPTFELGLCFVSAKALRKAVKKYVVLERRPIMNCRSFGIKIQFICQKPCKWKLSCVKKEAIPESTVMIICEPPEPGADAGRFRRMYVCLGPFY